jgi:hypothetical protein
MFIVPSQRYVQSRIRVRGEDTHAGAGDGGEFGGDAEDPSESCVGELNLGGGELLGGFVLTCNERQAIRTERGNKLKDLRGTFRARPSPLTMYTLRGSPIGT